MSISRRDALVGATVAVVVAGLPAVTNAANLGNPDVKLFALIDELESVCREHEKIAAAELQARQAIEARLPMPPKSIQFGRKRLGRDHVRRRLTLSPSLIEWMCAGDVRQHPERSEQIVTHYDRVLAELRAYEAEVDRLRNGPKVSALRARLDELHLRFDVLAAEIHATPARSLAGVLSKIQAGYPSGLGPAMIASAIDDLDRLAGEARS